MAGAEDAVPGLLDGMGGMDPGAAGGRVDEPDEAGTDAEAVIDTLLDTALAVFGREDLDGDERRVFKDALPGALTFEDDDVGDAVAGRADSGAQPGEGIPSEVAAISTSGA